MILRTVLHVYCLFHLSQEASKSTVDRQKKTYLPPPREHLLEHKSCVSGPGFSNESNFDCHGAWFVPSNGYFQPCNRHSHCYSSREPTDWCILMNEYKWTNWGCHCDYKLSSCVIERFHRRSNQLQWAYCTPKSEYYCASRLVGVQARGR